jgi:hypothetical protein
LVGLSKRLPCFPAGLLARREALQESRYNLCSDEVWSEIEAILASPSCEQQLISINRISIETSNSLHFLPGLVTRAGDKGGETVQALKGYIQHELVVPKD